MSSGFVSAQGYEYH